MPTFPKTWSDANVTICHDWLTGMRGGERVLDVLCKGFPNAPIVTLVHNPEAISDVINAHSVTTSWLQHVPGIMERYRVFLPFFPATIERLAPAQSQVLISTSHCVAKGLRAGPGTKHLCYCFTPMRYAWTFQQEYFLGKPLRALLARPLFAALRKWDRKVSVRVDRFVAISQHVRNRINRFYGREADVVYPPVDTDRLTPGSASHSGFDLIVSALVPYKRNDLAVRAYTQAGHSLKIVGVGGELDALRQVAGPNIEFLEWQADETILELYRTCRMLVFPGEEDFGIVPLEAQACGRPVCAFARGGALETVRDGVTGVFFAEQTVTSLLDAVERCAQTRWDPGAIRAQAETFDVQRFIDGMEDSLQKLQANGPDPESTRG